MTNRTVHKVKLLVAGEQRCYAPRGTVFRHFAEQRGEFFVWYDCDLNEPQREYSLFVVMTGQANIPPGSAYIGTVLTDGGALVLHAYEGPRPDDR